MNPRGSLLIRTLVVMAASAVLSLFTRTSALLPGFLLGIILGTANFMFLQSSVSAIFKSAPAAGEKNRVFKSLAGYFVRTIIKFAVLAILVFIFVKYLGIEWLGLITGLLASIIIFISEVLRAKKCQ